MVVVVAVLVVDVEVVLVVVITSQNLVQLCSINSRKPEEGAQYPSLAYFLQLLVSSPAGVVSTIVPPSSGHASRT